MTTSFGSTVKTACADSARGAAGSLLASTVMGAFMLAARQLGAFGEPPPRRLTRKLMRRMRQRQLTKEPALTVSTALAHYGYGAGVGALFGPLAARVQSRPLRAAIGAGIGTAVWAASYAGWIPASGLMPPPHRDTPRRVATMLAAHVLFGAALGLAFFGRRRGLTSAPPRTQSEVLDDELADTFPASDPPSLTQPPTKTV